MRLLHFAPTPDLPAICTCLVRLEPCQTLLRATHDAAAMPLSPRHLGQTKRAADQRCCCVAHRWVFRLDMPEEARVDLIDRLSTVRISSLLWRETRLLDGSLQLKMLT